MIQCDFMDDWWTICIEPQDYYMKFYVYEIVGIGNDNKPFWSKAEALTTPDPVESVELAEVFCSGDLKWDGCINYLFPSQETCMLHACGQVEAEGLGTMMKRIYELGAQHIGRWNP